MVVKTYLNIINDARDEVSPGTIPISRLEDTDAEAKRCRSAIQRAVRDLFAGHLSLASESKITTISTVIAQSLLTNVASNPWDTKMVLEMHWLDTTQTPNVRIPILPVTESKAEDLKLLTFTDDTPQYYYQKGNDLYVLPTPVAVETIYIRYNRQIPLLGLSDLTTSLDVDNEGILILTDLCSAHLRKGRDPEWKAYLAEAKAAAEVYYERMNFGLKNQGIRSIMNIRPNLADRSY